ncbi:2-hydroxyacid dehydrogenase [Dethiosulfovibrio salsuginis]|uniref:D-3-phosphoglycerate dehydrogenase n=1 Tax=Dethiosulfovibrio salsuginis TaxID=561720 RepID=A0A1X7IXA4_9BACT|nr:2-hydroxyacid dehydrogenase [Dethiosulfovibrio salsuginis]SMG19905.1 D-3-phosphoglycerate dehydrogenase [Dethiosulfovibrio salsuginis]
MRIVLLESLGVARGYLDGLVAPLLSQGHSFEAYCRSDDVKENVKRLAGADVAIIANMPLGGQVISSCDRLKMISVAFTGYDHVDMESCLSKRITVSNCAGYSTDSVVELALGLSLAVVRKIVPCDGAVRAGKTKDGLIGNQLAGKTVGIVGTGAIGVKVAAVFKALGCNVVAYSRSQRDEVLSMGIPYLSLKDLMSSCDLISLHLPCNGETAGLIDRDMISSMKRSSFLINTARGPIVDNKALADALKSGSIAGAGIDVFDMEPPLLEGYPLLDAPNCVLTPHVAFATPEALQSRAVIAIDNVRLWMDGKPQNVVR